MTKRSIGQEVKVSPIVSMGEVVICDFNHQNIQTLETGCVQSCVALAMYHKGGIGILGHFDSPVNINGALEELTEKLKGIGNFSNFSAQLVGGIVGECDYNTKSISDPIIRTLKQLGIEYKYKHYCGPTEDDTNFCVCVDGKKGILVFEDRNEKLSAMLLNQLDKNRKMELSERMWHETPQIDNLGYKLSVYGKVSSETMVKMGDWEHKRWMENFLKSEAEKSFCPTCVLF